MKAVIVINYASEEDIGKKTSIHLLNEENEWVEDVIIKPLPQKMTMEKALKMERVGSIKDIYTTWDACLDEITGETE